MNLQKTKFRNKIYKKVSVVRITTKLASKRKRIKLKKRPNKAISSQTN